MRRAALFGIALCAPAGLATAQAPDWSDLWRVADGTLVRPPAIAQGPTAAFWNPAAVVGSPGPAFAVDVYQTPDVVKTAGILLGGTYGLGHSIGVGLLGGRMAVSDLTRTTSSPVSEGGDIAVYSQFAGASGSARVGPLAAGAALLLHDARLDMLHAGAVTVDVGVRLTPLRGLALAAATHFGSLFTHGPATTYLGGVEYGFHSEPIFGLPSQWLFRYGLTLLESGGAEHLGSAGVMLADHLLIDAGARWASGYGTGAWTPILGVSFRAGPYHVGFTRGAGASDIGASYRLTLTVGGAW